MFKKTVVVRAMAAAFSAASLTALVIPAAHAQSNSVGTIYGRADSGSTVVLESTATGAKRTVITDASGRFQATGLQPGRYRVQLIKGAAVASSVEVEALIGQGVEAVFASTAQLGAVEVVGRRPSIDVTTAGATSTFTAKQLAGLPIGQDVTSIILLAPDTVKADSRYAGGASIGGGAPSENSYYINGFPVTNALSQLGSIELPFGAISQAQVMTGGFGAEFGRSTGGVVNITTKSGTNKWEGGANFQIEPESLRASQRNIFYPDNGSFNSATNNKVYQNQSDDTKTQYKYGAYVGGPIIPDKLFMFVAVDQTKTSQGIVNGASDSTTLATNGWMKEKDTNNRWLGKIDWNITDNHKIEFTTLGDNYTTNTRNYAYDYATGAKGATSNYSAHYENQANLTPAVGGQANILKYTGILAQDLTLTALVGQSKTPHKQTYSPDLSGGVPGTVFTDTTRAPGLNYVNAQPLAGLDISPQSSHDDTKSYRLDLEWSVGKHTLRGGVDLNKLRSSNAGEIEAGGSTWTFAKTAAPDGVKTAGPYTFVVNDGSLLGAQGYYVRQHIFNDVTDAQSNQSAEYLEDQYQATKDIKITMGLRNESFKGMNGDGQTYLKSDNFLSPRLSTVWDVNGDSSMKVYGTLGRYSIQTPTHLAVRGASRSTLTYQYFTYTGIDQVTGAPTGLHSLIPAAYSPDGETGQAKDPNTVAAQNLKPSYQDELTLGFEKSLARNLTGGVKMTYRRLGATLDDFCDGRPFENYAAAHGIDTSNWQSDGACISINPGKSNKFLVDYAGTGSNYTTVDLSAADIGLPKAKRTFFALDFFLEHAFADGWWGKVTYTYSKNKGNTEGQTKSDIGQTDVAATETWDFPQIMEGAYGYLPNDRTHQIKAFGLYQLTPEWMVGGNFTASAGRPKNCFGNYGGADPEGDPGYGSAFFYCSFDGSNSVPTPRGSQGRLPWDTALDANVAYSPQAIKGLTLRLDVFNLFNRQSALAINEIHEPDGDLSTVAATYGRVISYSAPRAVRLSASYAF